ncbi:MAG: FliM/FliN family flagellar motor switch protein [Burkholderiales bacterium]|nr:FliM/FliN family flagellar motor switch protein [Burkholderiales bacterium]
MTQPSHEAAPHLIELPELGANPGQGQALVAGALDAVQHVKVKLSVRVGDTTMSIGELMNLQQDQVVKLDSLADAPVDVMLDGRIVARGQLVAVDDNFGVRITELPKAQG